ncbi:lysoplasmalogenase family protein [Ramlibacter algicola]|uniref:Sterol desaturase family protein n=1 Tax=Ramlibacter algicola TaxID=2795217 RepID=A0A934Q4H4_9BURK|nr:lysoplasmalogenase family protein [Ramlibacter algicola]MBK0394743.1 sterol desaturase family protein [Ramlibacter algicola]
MSPSQVLVFATPVFLLLIAIEYAWGLARGRNTYRLNDAISSIGLGILSTVTAVLVPLLKIGLYTLAFQHLALWRNDGFWTAWYGWLLALLFYDFCYYWLHRAGHETALFWAAHVVHHQSQDYNLSTALRQTASGHLLGWVFYLPMALAGVPPLVFVVVGLVDLLYQFWVHTEHVPKLGWFDRWFCSPSNHRVHHAVNDRYLDRNYGGMLVVWDRLFGSFVEEDERCVYGTRSPLESWDPLWSNAEVYWGLLQDSWHARRWSDKLRVWFKPPGWRPADVAQRFPKPPFDITKVQRFHPPVTRAVAWFAGVQFLAMLGAVSLFLWNADSMRLASAFTWVAAIAAAQWAICAVVQGRIGMLQALAIEAGALAAATAAEGLVAWHQVFKPAALVALIAFVAVRLWRERRAMSFDALLLAGLALSLVGDVLLMLPGMFIAGLVAFLLAHLCFIVLFRQDVGWLPRPRALLATLGAGALMYAVLFASLGPVLRGAVAAYVVVIATMAAQAIGRAAVLQDRASRLVAVGAVLFMASDSLLAINRFALPLPLAQVWVLATYYAAQLLIATGARPAGAVPAAASTAPRSMPADPIPGRG